MVLTFNDEEKIRGIVKEEIVPLDQKVDKAIVLLDKFVGEIQAMREELVMVQGHRDTLEDHEERLVTVESSVTVGT